MPVACREVGALECEREGSPPSRVTRAKVVEGVGGDAAEERGTDDNVKTIDGLP